jgi:hypothetical protein
MLQGAVSAEDTGHYLYILRVAGGFSTNAPGLSFSRTLLRRAKNPGLFRATQPGCLAWHPRACRRLVIARRSSDAHTGMTEGMRRGMTDGDILPKRQKKGNAVLLSPSPVCLVWHAKALEFLRGVAGMSNHNWMRAADGGAESNASLICQPARLLPDSEHETSI